jgi:ribulose 1,5-bisphosphate synthetase/thiazole synthase
MNRNRTRQSRRQFLGATAIGSALGPQLVGAAESNTSAATNAGGFVEPSMTLPLDREADVIVCGAGPAGVTAAITAARAGARVQLFEWRGCLGGV